MNLRPSKKLLFDSNNVWPKFTFLYIISLILLVSLSLIAAGEYLLPWGNDGVIYPWPYTGIMANVAFLTKLEVSIASFIGEDHLAPVYIFYSYIISLFGESPVRTLFFATKIEFIIIYLSSIFVFHRLWKNSITTLLFSLLLAISLPMTHDNMTFPLL